MDRQKILSVIMKDLRAAMSLDARLKGLLIGPEDWRKAAITSENDDEFFAMLFRETWRVCLLDDGTVEINRWGIDNDAVDQQNSYQNLEALPNWMQQKIAVLMLFTEDGPRPEIAHIGRRISNKIFWIFPDGNT